jgi:hypothetical protein
MGWKLKNRINYELPKHIQLNNLAKTPLALAAKLSLTPWKVKEIMHSLFYSFLANFS